MDDDRLTKEISSVIFKSMANRPYKNVFYEFINRIFVFTIIIFVANSNHLHNIEPFSKPMKTETFLVCIVINDMAQKRKTSKRRESTISVGFFCRNKRSQESEFFKVYLINFTT